jgi:hypothetical protein
MAARGTRAAVDNAGHWLFLSIASPEAWIDYVAGHSSRVWLRQVSLKGAQIASYDELNPRFALSRLPWLLYICGALSMR